MATLDNSDESGAVAAHPFVRRPHRTFMALALPVLISLVAEPLVGLLDTAFVARLGAGPLAALGAGTVVLSSAFWVFNFLGIGAQTEVAAAQGAGRRDEVRDQTTSALLLAAVLGLVVLLAGQFLALPLARAMASDPDVVLDTALYLRVRLVGAPAVLVTTAVFGVLRGLEDMRTPLLTALVVNALNALLDPLLIFGAGPVPALGVAGAAWASVVSQVGGAALVLVLARRRLGGLGRARRDLTRRLVHIGGDLTLRTGMLSLFLILATREAVRLGSAEGAAHQAVRQVWIFAAFLLDAYAVSAQSLVGYFRGAARIDLMRRVARITLTWAVSSGVVIALALVLLQSLAERALVPVEARAAFAAAWWLGALMQPVGAVSFATDGLHWGAGDFRYLRWSMLLATGLGVAGLFFVRDMAPGLTGIWAVTVGWIGVRAALGLLRIWPGIGRSPFRPGKV